MMVVTAITFGQSVFTVTKITDPDPFEHPFNFDDALCDAEMYGTLQWAIRKANYVNDESLIVFDIPGEGPHEIILNKYLPQITSPINIDGTTQTGYIQGVPSIIINGQHMWAYGLNIYHASCSIKGLHIMNFIECGIFLRETNSCEISDNIITKIMTNPGLVVREAPSIGIKLLKCDNVTVSGNNINTTIEGILQSTPRYGMYIENSYNCLIGGQNQSSSNEISNCGDFGILINNSQLITLSRNIIYNNDKAISLINGANDNIQPPVINNYSGGILSGTAQPNTTIEVFGSTGEENANEYLVSTDTDGNGDWSVEVSTVYNYFITTETVLESTSEFSEVYFYLLNNYECPEVCTQNCNYICNSEMLCVENNYCGASNPPLGWFSSHGSCDYCENSINEEEPTCYFVFELNDDVDDLFEMSDFISFYSLFDTPNYEDQKKSEGIYTYLTNSLINGGNYTFSFSKCNKYNSEYYGKVDFYIRLIKPNIINNYFNNSGYEVPNIPPAVLNQNTYVLYHEQISSRQLLNSHTIPIPNINNLSDYVAIWIYAEPNDAEGTVATRFFIDDIRIEHDMYEYNATVNETCLSIGDEFILSISGLQGYNYHWIGPDGWESDQQVVMRTAENQNVFGSYQVTTSHDENCKYISEVVVNQNDLTTDLGQDYYICVGEQITLEPEISGGTQTYSFDWNIISTEESIIVEPLEETTYSVTVTDANDCTASDEITINVFPAPAPPDPYNTGPYCIGDNIELNVTNPNPDYQYTWSAQNSPGWSTPIELGEYHAIRPNAMNNTCCENSSIDYSGEYFVYVIDENGCEVSASTYVDVVPDQSCLTASTNCPICSGEDINIVLQSNENTSNQFCSIHESEILIEGINGSIPFELNVNTIVIPTDIMEIPESLTITITSPYNCQTTVLEVNDIIIYDNPTVSLPYHDYYCLNQEVEVVPEHSDFIVEYTWDGPDYFSHDPIASFTLPEGMGTEIPLGVTVTDYNGCTASASTILEVQEFFTFDVNATVTSPVCIGDPIQFEGSANSSSIYLNYHWSGPNGFNVYTPIAQITEATIDNIGTYILSVTDEYTGCYASEEVVVEVIDCDSEIDLTCTQIPATCRQPYNGAVEININNGSPPYIANISRGGNLLTTANLNDNGIHTINLDGVEPNGIPITLEVIDGLFNSHYFVIQEGLSYAWDLVLTNNNLHNQNYYDNITISVGDDWDNQNLDFYEDFSFTNCTIYTGTEHYGAWEGSEWNINIPNTVTFESCIIESGCPDLMWQGITVDGVEEITDADQNAHIIFSNSSISDANQAIRSYRNGTVLAINSTFSNNVYGIWMWDPNHNLNQISNNNFITERKLNHNTLYPQSHVFLYKVRHLTFRENDFKNTMAYDNPHYEIQKRGTGIESYVSSYKTPFIDGEVYSNKFEGLYYGINAKFQCDNAIQINYCDFVDNYRGVHMMALESPRLLFNDFYTTQEIPLAPELPGLPVNEEPETNISYAAYLNSCTNFIVEENEAKDLRVGFYVYNTGDAAGSTYYRNIFGDDPGIGVYNMEAGTMIVGKNSNWNFEIPSLINTGLEVRCNKYTSTLFAIGIINGNMRINQGNNSTVTSDLAGNQYHDLLGNGTDFVVQIDSEFDAFNAGEYNYWQHDDEISIENGFYRELLTYSIGVTPQTIDGVPYNENSCISNYDTPITPVNYALLIDEIGSLQALMDESIESYNNIVDNGNTAYMSELAEELNKHNFRQYSELLDNDGYLSNVVFEALLNNNSAQKPVIAAILIANSPLPVEIMEKVENSTYLSNGHKNMVRNYQSGISPRVLLEYDISDIKQEIASVESFIMNNAVNNDSVPIVKDTVISYFESFTQTDYNKLLNIYRLEYSKGDYASARATLAGIEALANADINQKQAYEYLEFCNVNYILLDYITDNNNGLVILEANSDILYRSALDGSALYSATAQVMYEIAADTVFSQYTPLPALVIEDRNTIITDRQEDQQFLPYVNAFPNPTDGIINIEYDFTAMYDVGNDILLEQTGTIRKDNCEKGELSLFTEDGKLLQAKKLNKTQDNITLDLKAFSPGIYFIEITDCYGNSKTLKVSKDR